MAAQNLPASSTPFIGRIDELNETARRLADPTCRLLTLVGPSGVGKTRLAIQTAFQETVNFEDGVYFVGLASMGSPQLLPAAMASALGISFYGSEEPAVQLIHYLQDKQILLVLDNFEHLLDETGLLLDVLAQAPQVKLLVTSRERLNVQEEWIVSVQGMGYPHQATPGEVDQYDAVRLFVQTACRVQPAFTLVDNLSGVVSICQQVEGMPLGLELAASWLRAMTCEQIAAELKRSLTSPK